MFFMQYCFDGSFYTAKKPTILIPREGPKSTPQGIFHLISVYQLFLSIGSLMDISVELFQLLQNDFTRGAG